MTARTYSPRHHPFGGPLKRHLSAKPSGRKNRLDVTHPAVVEGRTKYPHSVVDAADSPRLLISGFNSRKIGAKVIKGKWRGMPIYTLTLEERATCPKTCKEWRTCFGNNMNWTRRHRDDGELMPLLWCEIKTLASQHPEGFVVRLHVLGDFYSTTSARFWHLMLADHPELHIFGFTARRPSSPIGRLVAGMNANARCWIRFSGSAREMGSIVVAQGESGGGVPCPAQFGPERKGADCCGSCGLCWTTRKPIQFERH